MQSNEAEAALSRSQEPDFDFHLIKTVNLAELRELLAAVENKSLLTGLLRLARPGYRQFNQPNLWTNTKLGCGGRRSKSQGQRIKFHLNYWEALDCVKDVNLGFSVN